MILEELPYWIALTQLQGWRIEKTNKLVSLILDEMKISLEEFFQLSNEDLNSKANLNEKEINDLNLIKEQLPQFSFLAEDLLNQGYDILPINCVDYSDTLKNNLKNAPTILYIKGNKQLLKEKTIAIVGSRDADEISLKFTDNVAKAASKNFKVVVSGFAKGIDQQALDSAIKHIGQSIIVLPHGIMTFYAGFKKYYKQIIDGDVLVLSTFFPKAPWSVQLAMARNPIIYGLAQEIYVARSSDKGGTWEGVKDGLRKGRKIYVRQTEPEEKNANLQLIDNGAIPVDINGEIIGSIEKEISLDSSITEKQESLF